jgi:hypothetical protein
MAHQTAVSLIDDILAEEVSSAWYQSIVRRAWPEFTDAVVETDWVDIDTILPLSRVVHPERLARASRIRQLMELANVPLFAPMICPGDRAYFPPVVEEWGKQFFVIDGMHRLFEARQGLGKDVGVSLWVVRGVTAPLPISPIEWTEVRLAPQSISRAEKFPGYQPSLFRPIAKALDRLGRAIRSESELLSLISKESS